MDLLTEHTYDIKFNLNEIEYIGTLYLSSDTIPSISINTSEINFHEDVTDLPAFTCINIKNNAIYTIHFATLCRGVIHFKYLTTGDSLAINANRLDIYLSGLSEWIGDFYISDRELSQTNISLNWNCDSFSENFTFNNQTYHISNKRNLKTHHKKDEININVIDSISILKVNSSFTLNEADILIHEVRNLFSILTGYALSIKHGRLLDETNNKSSSIWLDCIKYKIKPLKSHHQSLTRFFYLIQENLFRNIMQNYFKSPNFRKIWNRLVPTLYENTHQCWEFSILGTVVILELYCEKVSKGQGHKLSSIKYHRLKEILRAAIHSFKAESELSIDDENIVDNISFAIENLRNTSHFSLNEKFEYLMHDLNPEIIKAIGFNSVDFTLIKKIRNCVAHGKPYEPTKEKDVTHEFKMKDRLTTLLFYFALRDLGFSDKQIAQCLSKTHHPIIINADGNEEARDKLAENTLFIELTNDQELPSNNLVYTLILIKEKQEDLYSLDRTLTEKMRITDATYTNLIEKAKSITPHADRYDFTYHNKIYLKLERKYIPYYGVILICEK